MNRKKLTEFLDSLEKRGIPANDCAVYYRHRPVYRHMTGYADVGRTVPLSERNTYWLYSASKLITCTAMMQLVEKGAAGLDDPVSDYLPEYGRLSVRTGAGIEPARHIPTIRHLLSMQSGMNYNLETPSIRNVLRETAGQAATRQVIRALAAEPLDFEPGTHFQYSISHDVLGAVIEAVSGQPLGEYLRAHIFRPLGMEDTGFRMTPERRSRLAAQYLFDEKTRQPSPMTAENNFVLSPRYESGGAGLISTVDDFVTFLDALCGAGENAAGCRILLPQTIDAIRTPQLSASSQKDFDDSFGRIGYSYGLGCRTLVDRESSRSRSPLGEYGWDGSAGAYALIDVKNQLAVFYAQHVRRSRFVYTEVHPRIRDLVYEMLGLDG